MQTVCAVPPQPKSVRRSGWVVSVLGSALLAASVTTGCVHRVLSSTPVSADYQPGNVFRPQGSLPPELRRVALLPITVPSHGAELEFGRDTLGPVLRGELARRQKFEIILVTAEQLHRWTGRSAWTAEDKLPNDFFEKIRESVGCDAVLFAHLTTYHPYPPLALGWRLKLVETDEPRVLWAIDEEFDASRPEVGQAARRYFRENAGGTLNPRDPELELLSPMRFGGYVANAVLATLPSR